MNTATIQTATTLNNTFTSAYRETHQSPFTKFFAWCTGQEENRLLWTSVMLAFHGCILTPIVVLLVAMTGVNMILLTACIVAMTLVLVTNLAALPTKYTLPSFVLSLIVDLVVIVAAFLL